MDRPGVKSPLRLALVPALLTSIAYVDPGNFAVNVAAGAGHGYALVWVVVCASAAAAVIQYLAAKLGLSTGRTLAEHVHDRSGRVTRGLHWAQAELIVIMTDLAEVVGGAIALQLLFGVPTVLGAVLVAGFSLVALGWRLRRGTDGWVPVVLGLLIVVVGATAAVVVRLGVDAPRLAAGLLPSLPAGSAMLAVGIIGATVMPHAVHFHSAVARTGGGRTDLRRTARSIAAAMGLAGVANLMLIMVAARLPAPAGESLTAVHASLPGWAATVFACALLASGAAASIVSVVTGQVVLQGFWRRPLPVWVQRVAALIPALAVLIMGLDASSALVLSQVVLAFALPGTLLPLIMITADRGVMGTRVNRRGTTVLALMLTAIIVGMDAYLIIDLLRSAW